MKRVTESIPIASQLSTLSDALRLRLLWLLEREELSVGEIARVVQIPQSTVSRHLKTLSDGGWLTRRSEGTASLYRLLLDDLDESVRPLWLTVRESIAASPSLELEGDLRRLGRVLDERRTDSRAFFGRVADEWQSLRTSLFGENFTAPGLLALLDPAWTVADLGCGSGDAARLLAPHVARVVGVDQSEAMLETASAVLRAHQNVDLVCGDLDAIPLGDACVDAAVLSLVLHHVEDPSVVIREAARILRSTAGGGTLIVIDMLAHGRDEYRRTMGHVHLGFDTAEVQRLLENADLNRVRVHELPTGTETRGPGLFVASGRI
ncbi:MAG: metalloregulator ArsR/SmtB family transcription factor [Planctomycetota bacterium]